MITVVVVVTPAVTITIAATVTITEEVTVTINWENGIGNSRINDDCKAVTTAMWVTGDQTEILLQGATPRFGPSWILA